MLYCIASAAETAADDPWRQYGVALHLSIQGYHRPCRASFYRESRHRLHSARDTRRTHDIKENRTAARHILVGP